jgi:dinuclear metal center YbgI/SA1388 family protein
MAVSDLGTVLAALDARYPPSWASSWDAVGLVCGDRSAPVRSVLFAVDPVDAVVDEARDRGVDLLVTHHPLFLTPVHGVAADTAKGALVHRLIKNDIALFVAHTNADVASPGVSDALGEALGLTNLTPMASHPESATDKMVVFVPTDAADALIDALSAAGAGAIGDYSRCAWTSTGLGTFVPGQRATPAVGQVGKREAVAETRVEMVLPRNARAQVVTALRAAHPYEEPAFDIYARADLDGATGLGRIGDLPEAMALESFVHLVADSVEVGRGGVRATGDPHRMVQRIAVCGGAGDSLLSRAASLGADVYVTGDLRHHREHVEDTSPAGPALIDATHYGTESPWLGQAADLLVRDLAALGATVEVHVSSVITDPWTMHAPSGRSTS